jgi:2-dehydro-3-deoxyphosphooctonate aldolase (KDO 8-P synthase)
MKHPVEKILNTRGIFEVSYENSEKAGVWLCERGNTFGYGALVVDMRNLLLLKQYAPVIFDATHSVQIPSTGGTTGGNSAFVPYMAKAAAAVGVDGFFFETHIDPSVAKSDGPNMLKIEDLYKTVSDIFAIQEALGYN